MPDRCCSVLSADRSAASIARALPSRRMQHRARRDRCRRRSTSCSIRTSRSSARKKAAAMSSPATTIGSRQFISAVKRASASIVALDVTSPPEPRSSASTRRTNSLRSNCGRSSASIAALVQRALRDTPVLRRSAAGSSRRRFGQLLAGDVASDRLRGRSCSRRADSKPSPSQRLHRHRHARPRRSRCG